MRATLRRISLRCAEKRRIALTPAATRASRPARDGVVDRRRPRRAVVRRAVAEMSLEKPSGTSRPVPAK